MKRICISLSCGVLMASMVFGLAGQAGAAEPYSSDGSYASELLPRAVISSGGGYYENFMGGATTYEESVLRGEAALMQAYGENAVNTAEAYRSYEAAVDQALDNKVKRLAVRQQREMMARTHRAELKRLKLARRQTSRAMHQEQRAEIEAAMSPAEKAAERERLAAGKLELARRLQEQGRIEAAREWMAGIVQEYPGTAAAREVSLMIAGR